MKMTQAEIFVLNQTLSCYPDGMTYLEVQERLAEYDERDSEDEEVDEDEDEGPIVWEPFEYMPVASLFEMQDNMLEALNNLLDTPYALLAEGVRVAANLSTTVYELYPDEEFVDDYDLKPKLAAALDWEERANEVISTRTTKEPA